MLQDRLLMLGTPSWDRVFRMMLSQSVGLIEEHGSQAHRYTFHVGADSRGWLEKYWLGKYNPSQALFFWYTIIRSAVTDA
jgi:hypothetical protein